MKNIRDNAVECRPQTPFEGGRPGEFEILMARFDMVFGAYHVPSRAKLLELSHWFSGAPKLIIDAYSLWSDADSAYSTVRSELVSLFGHTSDTVASLIETIKEGR